MITKTILINQSPKSKSTKKRYFLNKITSKFEANFLFKSDTPLDSIFLNKIRL